MWNYGRKVWDYGRKVWSQIGQGDVCTYGGSDRPIYPPPQKAGGPQQTRFFRCSGQTSFSLSQPHGQTLEDLPLTSHGRADSRLLGILVPNASQILDLASWRVAEIIFAVIGNDGPSKHRPFLERLDLAGTGRTAEYRLWGQQQVRGTV